MILSGSTGVQAAPEEGSVGNAADKIQPDLQAAFESNGQSNFWIRFADETDLSQERQIDDWVARGEAVADALRETAQRSQEGIITQLDGRDVNYQAFWATNAIFVHSGEAGLAASLATEAEVEGLYAPVQYELVEPKPGEAERRINAVEWGIANINADDVWNQFGVRGEGITVASIDTGTQFDHPALVDQYRGNLGGGEFDHNYNWFDAAGNCANAPCDLNGHGTHTMGTMVGDDGGENQIGVAPEANWITANGCCPSDAALIASGEWMLEPTDLNGENPDASKRPHIINNSWGTQLPSTDPFMEDVLEAWAASGIFGMWANGNSGEFGCASSGSPGSRIINYSSGAYNINNNIAVFSGRGPGQDGEIKPNISAPGVNVRSSFPGDSYGAISGTSMASPHVAGTIALLWSGAPSLIGDTETTKSLLDDSAVDKEDLECGGTADDNNVYGEGRLDALALMEDAPIGDTGTLAGTVTDASNGDPLGEATITITGDTERELSTGPDGTYSTSLPEGDYTVDASAFGYTGESAEVSVVVNETTTQDFALEPAANVTVSGTITDGSGHGWPMYAKVSVEGTDVSDYSNPFNGRYRLRLPANATYTLVVESELPGYQEVTETVEVAGGNLTHDMQTPVDAGSCSAPGYAFGSNGLSETFDSGELPEGWTVVDNVGNGQVWRFDNPGGRDNQTGGEGEFAIVDSDFYGSSGEQDTQLVSPVIDLSDVADPAIRFNQDFNWWTFGNDEFANVGLSIDGGETWETVFSQSGGDVPGPRQESVAIPQAGGEPDVQIRFHYGNASFEFWWQVDNVQVGSCDPIEGGLVAGHVRDRNTGDGINGATVTSLDNPEESTTTFATPDDSQRADGFYWMFSTITGRHQFAASADGYNDQTRRANVAADDVTRRNFRLAAGMLTVEPDSVEATIGLGDSAGRNLTITNEGTAPAEIELVESGGSFDMLGTDGTGQSGTVLRHADDSDAQTSPSLSGRPASDAGGLAPRPGPAMANNAAAEPGRTVTPTLPATPADSVTITHSESQEIVTGNSVACSPDGGFTTTANGYLRTFALEEFGISGDFDVTNVTFAVEALSPTHTLTVNLYTLEGEFVYDNMTLIGTADVTVEEQELGMVDVPVTGTAPAGSTLVVEIDAPDMSGTGRFFIGSNNAGQTAPSYLRAETCGIPEPTETADIGFPGMHIVMNVTGETGGSGGVPWMSVNPPTTTLQPGESVQARVALDADVAQPGTYTAEVVIAQDTPYDVAPVAVTMNVEAPDTWGKITGTVEGVACDDSTAPLEGAIVHIDGLQFDVTLTTDADGQYAYWIGSSNNELELVVASNGHIPQTRPAWIIPRQTVVENFSLQAIC